VFPGTELCGAHASRPIQPWMMRLNGHVPFTENEKYAFLLDILKGNISWEDGSKFIRKETGLER
jgi:hypothetical protein